MVVNEWEKSIIYPIKGKPLFSVSVVFRPRWCRNSVINILWAGSSKHTAVGCCSDYRRCLTRGRSRVQLPQSSACSVEQHVQKSWGALACTFLPFPHPHHPKNTSSMLLSFLLAAKQEWAPTAWVVEHQDLPTMVSKGFLAPKGLAASFPQVLLPFSPRGITADGTWARTGELHSAVCAVSQNQVSSLAKRGREERGGVGAQEDILKNKVLLQYQHICNFKKAQTASSHTITSSWWKTQVRKAALVRGEGALDGPRCCALRAGSAGWACWVTQELACSSEWEVIFNALDAIVRASCKLAEGKSI